MIKMVDETEFDIMGAEDGELAQGQLAAALQGVNPPAKKTRARKAATAKKEKKINPAIGLIEALKFVSVCQKKAGDQQVQFCVINNRWIAAGNEVLTVATPIAEDFAANAHTMQLIDALKQCKDDLQVVVLNEGCLSIKSGDFTGLVPCIGDGILNIDGPDGTCAAISDALKPALLSAASLTVENAPNEFLAGVLLQANSCVGTNGSAILEYWHGINLPTMLVPRQAAVAIGKCDKVLVGFGYSGQTATFWFEDGSFIKTRLYEPKYPNYAMFLDVEGINAFPLPDGLFEAVKLIEPFCTTGNIFFNEGFIYSDDLKTNASSYKLEGVPDQTAFNVKMFLALQPYAKQAHFFKEHKKVFIFGDNVRGCLVETLFTVYNKTEASQEGDY